MTKRSKKKIWVTDLIGDDFKKWDYKRILLGSGTGRGKTTFSLGVYSKDQLQRNKSVLYLCNRAKLKKQIRDNINEYGAFGVDCNTYQKLSKMILKGDVIPEYNVYICDEAHFFLADAEFNLYTDVVYEYILNRKNATVIFMTATHKNIFARIEKDLKKRNEEKPIKYFLPTEYDYVDKILWFKGQKGSVKGIVDKILRESPDEKIMYFCNSLTKMQKFYLDYSPDKGKGDDDKYIEDSQLKYMNFMCSNYDAEEDEDDEENSDVKKKKKTKANDKNYFIREHCSDDAIYYDENTGGYTFDGRVLVTTKVLDNGVDFKDKKIKHIICDVFDIESAIQCLGRKRVIDEDDTCIFYIRDYQYYEVNLFLKQIKNKLKSPTLFLKDKRSWIKKYGKDRSYKDYTLYFDFDILNDWTINTLRYDKLLHDEQLVTDMKEKVTSYRKEILDYLGDSVDGKSIDMEDVIAEKQMDSIEIYLKKHVGIKLSKEQQDEFIKLCNIRDRFNRLQKSIGSIQQYLLNMNYPYKIYSKRFKEKGKLKTYWIISEIEKTKKQIVNKPP